MKKIIFNTTLWLSLAVATNVIANSHQTNEHIYALKNVLDTPATIPPGYYPIKLGYFVITALNDGTMLFPASHTLTGAKPGEIEKALARNHRLTPTETSMNCYLINTGSKLILVDVGGGDIYRAGGLGRLLTNLSAAGYQPGQINAILLTHFHPDHAGGLLVNKSFAFPNADVYLGEADYDLMFGVSGNKLRTQLSDLIKLFTPLKDAGKLKTIKSRKELFPGVTAIPTPGHTPGHTSYLVSSGSEKLFIWGDIVHVGEVQFANPTVAFILDANQASAIAQRKAIFAEAQKNGYLIGGAHIPFPGLGYVASDANQYRWIPLTYSTGNKTLILK